MLLPNDLSLLFCAVPYCLPALRVSLVDVARCKRNARLRKFSEWLSHLVRVLFGALGPLLQTYTWAPSTCTKKTRCFGSVLLCHEQGRNPCPLLLK